MDYSQWVSTISVALATDSSDENLTALLASAVDYAEDRIYRDPAFDFLTLRNADYAVCTIGSRKITRPASVLIVEGINILTPAGAVAGDDDLERVPLERVSLGFLDQVWGSGANTPGMSGVPSKYAPLSDTDFRIGALPDDAYLAEFVGPTRPEPLSDANRTTFLTLNMPALFTAASMVYLCGTYLKNFGAQSDNPQQAQSWENQFGVLKLGPAVEEARRKSESASWQPKPPTVIAKPER
jgi:hypothetical protein